jgi:hypothetical protein
MDESIAEMRIPLDNRLVRICDAMFYDMTPMQEE